MEPALFLILHIVNPIQVCHTYPTWMKTVTVIPYLKKIQKMYESRDPPPDINIFHLESANFVISRNTDIDSNLMHNF